MVEKLNQGFRKVLMLINHPDRDHLEQSVRLISAQRWLEESAANGTSQWLIILDNISQEAISFLQQHFPHKNLMENILLTTWTWVIAEAVASVAGQQHTILELWAPDLCDATSQLLKEAGISMSNTELTSMDGAEPLVKCVGHLPLTISHAASFAKQSYLNLNDVLALYQSKYSYEVSFHPSILVSCAF
jgi:hypothetical protein